MKMKQGVGEAALVSLIDMDNDIAHLEPLSSPGAEGVGENANPIRARVSSLSR